MSRPYRARALAALVALAAAGCQDYNFNPVGHCLLQPGSQRFTLSNVSSADVLFVVDDSNSMAGEQVRLAVAFDDFVANLTSTNRARAQGGLLPLDFHVAVTSTSVFMNREPLGSSQTCRADCAGAGGQLACCIGTTPVYGPRSCTTLGAGAPECPVQSPTATACRDTCDGHKGTKMCCASDGSFPANSIDGTIVQAPDVTGGAIVRCSAAGLPCGKLETHFPDAGECTAATRGIALPEFPFPDGAFVGSISPVPASPKANPRVLHFDKQLYLSSAGKNAQGFTMDELKRFFEQNAQVGTCGSPQEQGLRAARHAVELALTREQYDTYPYDYAVGLTSTAPPAVPISKTFTVSAAGVPHLVDRAVWPTPNSKLVVVWVGDEDDCSSPADPSGGVVLLKTGDAAGHDACTRDVTEAPPLGGKQASVASFVDYLTGLGRPLGAAFVVSANSGAQDDSDCRNDGCVANICCDRACTSAPPYGLANVCSYDVCGGQAPGSRYVEAAKQLKAKGADVVVGSVCGDFRPLLREVAEIVKPPQTLTLPTLPAESAIAILRIASGSGDTRKICGRPLAPRRAPAYTRAEAEATGADWWFTASGDPGPPFDPTPAGTDTPVSVPTGFVYINPKGSCIANPGETYSADYLGVVPQPLPGQGLKTGGCDPAVGPADCQSRLGGAVTDWQCSALPGTDWGTCNCRSGG